jgi:hypothetical protein
MIIEQPWPHIIIDEFYDQTFFDAMRQEIIGHVKKNGIRSSQTFYRSTDPTFEYQFPITSQCCASRNYIELLGQFKDHRDYSTLSCYHEINVIIDGYDYPIHDENPRKVLSVVTYITPEESTGTLIYDCDKNFVKEVEWKPNRTLVFAGLTNITWHAYRVERMMPRITLNTFLTNDMA